MRALLTLLTLIFVGFSVACASHGYDRGYYDRDHYGRENYEAVARAAHRLQDSAEHFYRQLRYDVGHDHATRDAGKFAEAASHFHRNVERGASFGHIRDDYEKLHRAYAHVRHDLSRRHDLHHNPHTGHAFREVERAFADLNRAIGQASGRSRYPDH